MEHVPEALGAIVDGAERLSELRHTKKTGPFSSVQMLDQITACVDRLIELTQKWIKATEKNDMTAACEERLNRLQQFLQYLLYLHHIRERGKSEGDIAIGSRMANFAVAAKLASTNFAKLLYVTTATPASNERVADVRAMNSELRSLCSKLDSIWAIEEYQHRGAHNLFEDTDKRRKELTPHTTQLTPPRKSTKSPGRLKSKKRGKNKKE